MIPLRHDYQDAAKQWCESRKAGLLDIDMGLGKTRIMLDFINDNNLSALVVAPIRVMQLTWPEEIATWTPGLTYCTLHGRHKEFNYGGNQRIKLINFEGLKWLLAMWEKNPVPLHNRVLIVDESAKIRSSSSVAFKALRKMLNAFKRRFLLSATPCPNGYIGLWSQYYLIDEGATLGMHFSTFKQNYFIDHGAPSYRITPRSSEALKTIRDKVTHMTFRLDQKDHLNLPSIVYVNRKVQLPAVAMARYEEMRKDFITVINGHEIVALNENSVLIKLRQLIQGAVYTGENNSSFTELHEAKLDALEDLVAEANGNPLMVAIQFKFEVEMLTRRFGPLPVLAGGCKDPASIKDAWNRGEIPILLCHPASVGHGLNMQKGGHHLIWYSPSWDWEQYHQLAGRLHRQGQTKVVVVTHLVAQDTLDEVIYRSLRAKGSTQRTFNDAVRIAMISGHTRAVHGRAQEP